MRPGWLPRRARNRISLRGAAAILVLAAAPAPAMAQAGHWVGGWRQLESNAGQCTSCRIVITGTGRDLTVTANNGWIARVAADVEGGLAAARGEGRWEGAANPRLSGLPFSIHFIERGARLHMTMRIPTAERLWTIRAAFGRAEGN
ncbi:MAG: hypothetical protein M9932_05310 [Xanthobacteraceae bacterium]|nr:hypothetical protein [Xanthobacteraceae bacterium]